MEGCFKVIKEEERREGREREEDKIIMRNPSLDQCIMEHKESEVT